MLNHEPLSVAAYGAATYNSAGGQLPAFYANVAYEFSHGWSEMEAIWTNEATDFHLGSLSA
ncbi:hypothetical protein V6Z96_002449 [Aspergillus fumigatus]|jgi:hypothetical protein